MENFTRIDSHWINPDSPWDMVRGKYLFENPKILNRDSKENNLLSLTLNGVLNKDMDSGGGLRPDSYDSYQIFYENDLVFKLIDLENVKTSRVGWVHETGLMSPVYIRLKPKEDRINTRYFYYYFFDLYQRHIFNSIGSGIRSSLSGTNLLELLVPNPPYEEQNKIVNFLDKKIAKIDELIKKIEQKIGLLKEQRTSLINKVVTQGLNPNVKKKESGVEWIGEIPSHWEITKLKYKGNVIIGLSYTPDNITDENNGTLVLRSSNVQSGKLCLEDTVYVNSDISEKLRIRENDILICSRNGSRKLIGKNCLISKDVEGSTWGVFMSIYRCESPVFFYWLLNSSVFKSQSGLFLTSTINQLTVSTLENMFVPYVSDLNEQKEIVEYLEIETQKIDEIISNEEERIKLLKEYKQSLVFEVVTGKKKVVS